MKRNNIQIIGIPEGEEQEQGIETLLEKIMTENFLNVERGKQYKFRKNRRSQSRYNKRPSTIIKMAKVKDKERILKAAREKQIVA